MPANSIDTFFACTLVVSVALIATAFLAGTMHTQISSMQDLNKQDYLQTIADHIASGCGAPTDWGSSGSIPDSFGLSASNAAGLWILDTDKVTRLNSQNIYALAYPQVSQAAKLNNIAFGASIAQMLQIEITPLSNSTTGDVSSYTFQVAVSGDAGPVNANLHYYAVAHDFENMASNATSSQGIGEVTVELPSSARGPALLVVFARATFDDSLTVYAVYPFVHLSGDLEPNRTFLTLSPLNNTLTVNSTYPNTTVENAYAFSYSYQTNLTSASNSSYTFPAFTDKSPTVLVTQGTNGTLQFNEWTAYPQIPVNFGADFSQSETNVFTYPVTINDVLYRLTLRFGDVVK
jgi:hypothetical protein